MVIIGAGPAGLGASIYASRYKLNHIVIGNEIGGQVVEAAEIENWAGELSIPGRTLMEKFQYHAHRLGAKIIRQDVVNVDKVEEGFKVFDKENKEYPAKSLIFALGMKPRKMNIPGEDKFIGRGISYCATCDAMFFREKDVLVIGGGDAAATAAIHLTEFAKKVYLLYCGECIWEPSWGDQLKKTGVEEICCTSIKEIKGDQRVSGVIYKTESADMELTVQGVFIEVGTIPGIAIAKELGVATDDQDYIIVDQTQATNIENVYAAGDVTTGSNKFRQIITAVAEGAVASGSVYKKLKLNKK